MHAWVSLGHYLQALEPTVLRVACQYVLSLRNIAVWPEQPALHAGSDLWQGLMEQGVRLPPLHYCCLGPCDFYRRVYCGTSASLRTVAGGPLEYTRAYLARPSPLTMNGVAGELLGLVPVLRRVHCDLRGWLARDHPAHLHAAPDILVGGRVADATPGAIALAVSSVTMLRGGAAPPCSASTDVMPFVGDSLMR